MFGKTINLQPVEEKELRLSPISNPDYALMAKWMNNPDTSRYLSMPNGFTTLMEEEWIKKVTKEEDSYRWGIYLNNVQIGNCGLFKINPIGRNAHYGVLIGEQSAWGKGIGTQVAKAAADYGFVELNLENIFAEVFSANPASKKALEKAGFIEYGVKPRAAWINGEYVDEWMCYKSRN